MKKIVPFKKDIIFEDTIFEISSIALEHALKATETSLVKGDFEIEGTYKATESSTVCKEFSYKLPFEIHLDEKYDLSNMTIAIDDFYYEIVNNKVLMIRVEVLLDALEEKQEEIEEMVEENTAEEMVERCIEEETEVVSQEEMYQNYKIYIMREGDTLETIMEKYHVTKEQLEDYNDFTTLEKNMKIIIPYIYETNS